MKQASLNAFYDKKRKFDGITNHLDSLNGSGKPPVKKLHITTAKNEVNTDDEIRITGNKIIPETSNIGISQKTNESNSSEDDSNSTNETEQQSKSDLDNENHRSDDENYDENDERDDTEEKSESNKSAIGELSPEKNVSTQKKKKTAKSSFLEEYVENKDSSYKPWIVYDAAKDSLFCSLCVKASEKHHNTWL